MNKLILSFILVITIGVGAFAFKSSQQQKLYQTLTPLLITYSASDGQGPIKLTHLGKNNDGGYAAPLKALQQSDILMGYGIATDSSFEEEYSNQFNKPSYGFDCGVSPTSNTSKQFTFINECIANDSYLYSDQSSSHQISSFTQQLKNLGLSNKKIFIKMDIEGAEYQAFDDILQYATNITGIVLEIHFAQKDQVEKAIHLLSALKHDFLLLHLHGNNCTKHYFSTQNTRGDIPTVLELTYINKNLVRTHEVANNQTHPTPLDMPNCLSRVDAHFEIMARKI